MFRDFSIENFNFSLIRKLSNIFGTVLRDLYSLIGWSTVSRCTYLALAGDNVLYEDRVRKVIENFQLFTKACSGPNEISNYIEDGDEFRH